MQTMSEKYNRNVPSYPLSSSFAPFSEGDVEGEATFKLVAPNLTLIFFGGSSPGFVRPGITDPSFCDPRSGFLALLRRSSGSSSSSSRRRFSLGRIGPIDIPAIIPGSGVGGRDLDRTNASNRLPSSSLSSFEARFGGPPCNVGTAICRCESRGLVGISGVRENVAFCGICDGRLEEQVFVTRSRILLIFVVIHECPK